MKNIKELIKKHDNITMILILVIVTFTIAFIVEFNAGDILYNFSNIYKMSQGYEIYKNLNVIITPLFFYIGNIIFNIFGANMLVYNVYHGPLLYILTFFIVYKIFKKLKIQKINAMLYTTIIAIVISFIACEGAYNILAIMFILLGIYNLLKEKDTVSNGILQGFITFLIFMTKQNMGCYYLLGSIAVFLVIKKDKKTIIKNIFVQIVTFWTLLLVYALYLQANGNLYNFINYAFLGIGEFSKENFEIEEGSLIFNIATIILSITMISLTYIKKIKFDDERKKNIRILGIMSICNILIAYPLINSAHTVIGNVIFMILIAYILNLLLFKELLTGPKVNKIRNIVLIIIITFMFVINTINTINYINTINANEYYFEKDSPYYGAIVKEETLRDIKEVCKYIEEQNKQNIEVKVVSNFANLYMNLLNKNNGKFDLPFYGNFGSGGEKGFIEEIKKLNNTKILLNDKYRHFQESKTIENFIRENYEFEGNISMYSIYSVNNF